MNTLEIEIPNGYMIDTVDSSSGVIKLKEKPKKVTERIKTVADVLADNGLSQSQFDKQCEGLEEDEVAYRILKLLAKSLNEGWTPDWDKDDYKYWPWFYMGGSSGFRYGDYAVWSSHSYVGSRLCFKSEELAKYAANQFTHVYKQFNL